MAAIDIIGAWVRFLPKQLTVENGDTFGLEWHDGKEWTPDLKPPYGTIVRISRNPDSRVFHYGADATTLQDTDVFTFTTGTDVYRVEEKDIRSVTSLTGTKGGLSHTFVKGTDFDLHKTDGYSTYDAIKWLDGGAKPDAGTNFTLVYYHRVYDTHSGDYERQVYRLILTAKAYASGEGPATTNYNKTTLAELLGDALLDHLGKNRGRTLDSDHTLKISGFMPISSAMNVEEGQSVAVWWVDVLIFRRNRVTTGQVKTIGRVKSTFNYEGP